MKTEKQYQRELFGGNFFKINRHAHRYDKFIDDKIKKYLSIGIKITYKGDPYGMQILFNNNDVMYIIDFGYSSFCGYGFIVRGNKKIFDWMFIRPSYETMYKLKEAIQQKETIFDHDFLK